MPDGPSDPRDVDLEELERLVLNEVATYQYEVPEGALGRPLPDEWLQAQLSELRAALIKPEWGDLCINEPPRENESDRCVLVARNADSDEVWYVPHDGDFVLASGGVGYGVRVDVVGCFLAR